MARGTPHPVGHRAPCALATEVRHRERMERARGSMVAVGSGPLDDDPPPSGQTGWEHGDPPGRDPYNFP